MLYGYAVHDLTDYWYGRSINSQYALVYYLNLLYVLVYKLVPIIIFYLAKVTKSCLGKLGCTTDRARGALLSFD